MSQSEGKIGISRVRYHKTNNSLEHCSIQAFYRGSQKGRPQKGQSSSKIS